MQKSLDRLTLEELALLDEQYSQNGGETANEETEEEIDQGKEEQQNNKDISAASDTTADAAGTPQPSPSPNTLDKEALIHQQILALEQEKNKISESVIGKEEYEELVMVAPYEAALKLDESRKLEQRKQELYQKQLELLQSRNNYKMFPDLDSKVEGIIQVMREDNVPEDVIGRFKESPSSFLPESQMFQILKRAELIHQKRTYEQKIQELESKVQESSTKTKETINKIKHLNQHNPTSGGLPPANVGKKQLDTSKSLTRMTLDELKQLEQELSNGKQ